MRTGRMKRGFTLIETVVTVGIVAAMAAVVIPQVARQFDAADPTRISNDLKNIQTAIETYSVNVRTLPGDLDDLANPLTVGAGGDSTITTATSAPRLDGNEASLWQGPYLDQSIVEVATESLIGTAYGANILDSFVCYNSANNEHGISEGSGTGALNDIACPNAPTAGQQMFLAIQITGIACSTTAGSTFMTLNALFDVGEAAGSEDDLGRVRCTLATDTDSKDTSVDVVYFLAVPIS